MQFDKAYTDLKIFHHYEKIKEMCDGKQPYPISLRLVISDLCNHNCHFCTFRMENSNTNKTFGEFDPVKNAINFNPKRFLSKEKTLEIIKDCKEMGVKSIEFTGGGEPTVHPDHVLFFEEVIKNGMDLGLITNGALMRKGFEDAILKAAWCRFSIDAGHKKTYAKIREVSERTFERVLKNIKIIAEKKKKENSSVVLGTSFIVTEQNYLEVYKCAKLMKDLGVDYFRIGYYRTDEGFVAGDYDIVVKQIEKAKKDFERKDFKVIDRYSEASENIDDRPDYKFCGYQHISTWISADYNVYRCCVTSYDQSGLIGSIKNRSFKNLWDSEEKKKNMKNFDARSCDHCIYNKKNKVLNYVTSKKPKHVNFM